MALGFLYTCSCGQRFKAYVPKHKLFHAMTGGTVDWAGIDRREQEEGVVEEVQRQARFTRSNYVDLRGGERLKCARCQREVDLVKHFRAVMTALTRPTRSPPLS